MSMEDEQEEAPSEFERVLSDALEEAEKRTTEQEEAPSDLQRVLSAALEEAEKRTDEQEDTLSEESDSTDGTYHADIADDAIYPALSVPFLHTRAETDPEVLKAQRERAEELVDAHPQGYGANFTERCGSWNSTDLYDAILDEESEEAFQPINEHIARLLPRYLTALGADWSGMSPCVTESWLNANPPGNVQECHIHPHCYIAGVYYIEIPDGRGNEFVLDSPIGYEHEIGLTDESGLKDETVDVSSGDMILFPSNIEHHTVVNTSDQFRYSLAFNITTTELLPRYWSDQGGVP